VKREGLREANKKGFSDSAGLSLQAGKDGAETERRFWRTMRQKGAGIRKSDEPNDATRRIYHIPEEAVTAIQQPSFSSLQS
jgi:hypothetical protein